jgi:hypothetical protein
MADLLPNFECHKICKFKIQKFIVNVQGVLEGIVKNLGGGIMDNSKEISSCKHVSNFLMGMKIQLFEFGV